MLVPTSLLGHRFASMFPPMGSMRVTSAPSWASVIPPGRADLDDGQAGQRCRTTVRHGCSQCSVVTVAAIAVKPSGVMASSSWAVSSVCRPTRWICSLANSGDFAVNR